jgi:hypothetical protein
MLMGILLHDIAVTSKFKPILLCPPIHFTKEQRRPIVFIRVKSNTNNHVLVRQSELIMLHRVLRGEVTKEAHDVVYL